MSATESGTAGSGIMAASGIAAASGVGAPIAAAGLLAGAGLSIYGQIAGASAQADAAQKDAQLKNAQADEMLSRQYVNEQILLEQGAFSEKNYASEFADLGREGGGIGGILKIHSDTLRNITNSRRDAEFKAQQIRAGATMETNLASDALTASWITGAGTLLSTGAQAYSAFKGPGKSQSFDSMPTTGSSADTQYFGKLS